MGDILEHDVDDSFTISDKLWAGHQRRKEANRLKGKGFGYSLFDEIHNTQILFQPAIIRMAVKF